MTEQKKHEPKKITPETTEFEANGKKYYVAKSVSIARYEEYEKIQPLLTFGVDFKSIFKNIRKAWDYLNDPKGRNDAAVVLHNLMSAITEIEKEDRAEPGLLICALFINREGEDVAVYDKQIALDKINDWRKEGYDIDSFFLLALNSIAGFRQTYVEYINQLSQEKVNLKQKNT